MNEGNGEQVAAPHKLSVNGTKPSNSPPVTFDDSLSTSIDISRYISLGTFLTSTQTESLQIFPDWTEINAALVGSLDFKGSKQLSQLSSKDWTRVFAKQAARNDSRCHLRVYLLPDDVGRAQVPRTQKKLRTYLRIVLAEIDRSSGAWMGYIPSSTGDKGYYPEAADDDSLFYIFNTLDSPRPVPDDVFDYNAANAMQDLLKGGKAQQGLNTELYQYQRRSCAKMIQRESQPELGLDPRLETLIGPTHETFYLDRNSCEVFSEPRTYQEARGGILAETMGYGKTLICLATIIATKGCLPETPPEFLTSVGADRQQSGPRSLSDTCALNIAKANIQWKLYFQERAKGGEHFDRCVKLLAQSIGRYKIPIVHGRSRRVTTSVQTMHLASTTLIIVPPNLLKQWQRQIHQHVHSDVLSMLQVDSPRVSLKEPDALRFFDLILMSSQRFEEEMFPLGGNRGTADLMQCTCADPVRYRLCQDHPYRSPLRDVHFLRVIVDEGHRFGSGSTTQAIMALKTLKVDAKWIVSGTPAGDLVGVEVDLAAEESFADLQLSKDASAYTSESDSFGATTNEAAKDPQNEVSGDSDGPQDAESINGSLSKLQKNLAGRKKAKNVVEERKSIERLGHIVKSFLRVQPWANDELEDGANWNTYIVPNKNGTRKPVSLRNVLSGLVVRHQYGDVERDLRLPPLENKLVLLKPCFFDKLSLNLFILSLTVNAVTSERKDQDYMFHPRNRKSLESLIKNLRHAGFTWSGFTAEEIEKTCNVSQRYMEKANGALAKVDETLLEGAITVGFIAQCTPAWKALNTFSEIGLFVAGIPHEHKMALTLCPEAEPRHDPCVVGAAQLCNAQEAVEAELYSCDFQKTIRNISKGKQNGVLHSEKKPQHTSMLKESPRKSSELSRGIPQSGISEVKKITASKFSTVTVRTRQRPLSVSEEEAMLVRSRSVANGDLKPILRVHQRKPDIPPTYPHISKSKLVGTSSAKLSYLIDKVYGLYKTEKILIFYEGDDIAYYCAQVFELLGIPHLIYARGISQALRNEYQTMFNMGTIYRVLLMDLQQAALGLHMASASRVFFINPVWQPTIEAQAIKRAHRIGQTKPVFVETLVLEGTIEEQMLQRRKKMSAEEHQKAARSLLDDTPMKDIIQNASLLPILPEEINDHSLQFAPLQEAQQLFARSIVSAYGSHEAVLEALNKAANNTSSKVNMDGSNGFIPEDAPRPDTKLSNGAVPRFASKKRKLVFVDELERRKINPSNGEGEAQTLNEVPNEAEPEAKRRRSSKITFADERDLPLSTTYILPAEDEALPNEHA